MASEGELPLSGNVVHAWRSVENVPSSDETHTEVLPARGSTMFASSVVSLRTPSTALDWAANTSHAPSETS